MRKTRQTSNERIVKDVKRKMRKRYSAEEKIRIILDGLCPVKRALLNCAAERVYHKA